MKICIVYLGVLCLFNSCKKFIDIPKPRTQAESQKIFQNEEAANSAVIGLYSEMSRTNLNIFNGGLTLYPGLSADELYNTAPNTELDGFTTNSILPTFSLGLGRLWFQAYRYIYQANAVLEGLENPINIKDSVLKRLKGEMLFTRALSYYFLVNLYGDVPLELSTNYKANAVLPRTDASTVVQRIKSDLIASKSLMTETYPGINRARPNKHTASALLARVFLLSEDWANAEAEASEVIQSSSYSLVTNLDNVFLPGSTETIWQLIRDNQNTAEGFTFVPSSTTTRPTYALTNGLFSSFSATDKRKTSWIRQNTVSSIVYPYAFKYKVRAQTPITEYYVVFRLAEMILLRAEARAQLNNVLGAQQDLNLIRQRAGLLPTTATDKPGLLTAIENERRLELFVEWGHRWFDLKRWGRANAILGPLKSPNWHSTDVLYPITKDDLETNPFLVQNPGY